jgi:hypothetical protein
MLHVRLMTLISFVFFAGKNWLPLATRLVFCVGKCCNSVNVVQSTVAVYTKLRGESLPNSTSAGVSHAAFSEPKNCDQNSWVLFFNSYKHVSNFQWVWRYSCFNVTHKKPYKRYEGKSNDLLIAFIGYVNDLNKMQQFEVSVKKSHHRFQCTFQLPWQ